MAAASVAAEAAADGVEPAVGVPRAVEPEPSCADDTVAKGRPGLQESTRPSATAAMAAAPPPVDASPASAAASHADDDEEEQAIVPPVQLLLLKPPPLLAVDAL